MSDAFTELVSSARVHLERIDDEIEALRTERRQINNRIAGLVLQRKSAARIVRASEPRKASGNGESE